MLCAVEEGVLPVVEYVAARGVEAGRGGVQEGEREGEGEGGEGGHISPPRTPRQERAGQRKYRRTVSASNARSLAAQQRRRRLAQSKGEPSPLWGLLDEYPSAAVEQGRDAVDVGVGVLPPCPEILLQAAKSSVSTVLGAVEKPMDVGEVLKAQLQESGRLLAEVETVL